MKQLRIVSKIRSPHGGVYSWPDPLLPGSAEVVGTTWEMLVERARKQRWANGFATGLEFEKELEQAVCMRYPQECSGWDEEIPRPRQLSMLDVLNGTRVMLAHKLAGSPLESPEVAYARAQICADNHCGQNVEFHKRCGSCHDVENLVTSIIGNATTPFDSKLKSCSICGCVLKAAVWTTLAVQAKGVTDTMREQFKRVAARMEADGHIGCWKAAI